ncbi:MAG: PepSY domain-containing protein, partial [Lachnospiraceae bacterium]|nr:PepSY domain-containing protein [Lachnospiraceae bacterium]
STEPVPTQPVPTQPVPTEPVPTQPTAPEMIGLEKAKKIALEDAGRSASEVVFTKAKQEKEDGRQIYDIEFFVEGVMEYEYEIDVYTGAILEKDSESLRPVTEPTQPVPTEPVPTEPVPTQPVPTQPVPTEPVPTQPTAPEMIGLEKAKKIALQDAGLSASEVVFSKARLEKDDGEYFYEIEFFIRGEREYEYEIDPFTGRILERESEPWDD